MVGWHHRLDGHEFEYAPGVGDGPGSLACCSPWGRKESDWTELYCTELNWEFLLASVYAWSFARRGRWRDAGWERGFPSWFWSAAGGGSCSTGDPLASGSCKTHDFCRVWLFQQYVWLLQHSGPLMPGSQELPCYRGTILWQFWVLPRIAERWTASPGIFSYGFGAGSNAWHLPVDGSSGTPAAHFHSERCEVTSHRGLHFPDN